MMFHSTLRVRLLSQAFLLAGICLSAAGSARAEPSAGPAVPPEEAAVAFVSSINDFAAGLDDKLLIYSTSVFFRDEASYDKAVGLKAEKLRQLFAMKFRWVARKGLRYILYPASPVPADSDPEGSVPAGKASAGKVSAGKASAGKASGGSVPAGTAPAAAAPTGLPRALVVFFVDGIFKIDLVMSYKYSQPPPPDPEPVNQYPTLADALVGVEGEGALTAIFHFGPDADIHCRLLPEEAPQTVASFVALARGLRYVRQETVVPGQAEKQVSWSRRPWYNDSRGTPVFGRRVLRLEGTQPTGFFIEDELSEGRRHDRPALLTTIPASPDMWYGAIGITTTPVSELDDVGTIFGLCDEAVVEKNARIWSVNKGEPFIPPLVNISIVRE